VNSPVVIFHKQLGDVVLMEPALAKAAAASGTNVTLNTRAAFAPLVQLMPNVEPAGTLPLEAASMVISFSPRTRAAIKAALTPADKKLAIFNNPSQTRWWHRLIYHDGCSVLGNTSLYRGKYFFDAMPCEERIQYRPPSLTPPPSHWLPQGLPGDYVLVHATSAWKRKSWCAENWAAALDVLHDSGVGPFVCSSGPDEWEKAFIRSIQAATRASLINLAGKTSLQNYLAIIANSRLVLCIDGSATHIAAAFRRPCVTLFGPTNPLHWHYHSEHSTLIDARRFVDHQNPPTDAIPVEPVAAAAQTLWKAFPTPPTSHNPDMPSAAELFTAPQTARRPRILYVYSGKAKETNQGLDLVVRQQLKALTDANYEVTFVSRGKFVHPLVHNFSMPFTPANLFSYLRARYYYNLQHRFFAWLGSLMVIQTQFDAVIGWEGTGAKLFKQARSKQIPCLLNCPVVCTIPNQTPETHLPASSTWPLQSAIQIHQEYQLATKLLTASEIARSTFLEAGFQPDKVVNIQRGADINRFAPAPKKRRPYRAVFFGRVCPRKGIFQVIEAWNKAALPESELWIIGSIEKEIESELRTKLPSNARLFGHRNDPETLLPQCHVQILPSALEGMAKTLIEGAACGCVSLVTRETGFPLSEGKTGYYIERNDTDEIAKRLTFLASADCNLDEMAKESAAFVQSMLNWGQFRQRFLETVRQTAASQECAIL
jgi:ADP-heptose:LPS heptosyltransferase/glycosyltransferase involved in cell wall biosynthesis